MRTKLLKVVVVILLAGCGDCRPQKQEEPVQSKVVETTGEEWKPVHQSNATKELREDSSVQVNDAQRHLKDLQYMDQSLRTVATQLLNVTDPKETLKMADEDRKKTDVSLVKEINSEISKLESMGTGFGRPVNSKFGYFESSHPGQAMAMTEEELEKEMSSTRLMTAYKNHPTTTGGISTWILLNPPSTTVKTNENEKTKQPIETDSRTTVKPSNTMERVETTIKVVDKLTSSASSTVLSDKVASSTKKTVVATKRTTTTAKPEMTSERLEKLEPVKVNITDAPRTTTSSSLEIKEVSSSIGTTKKAQIVRTTAKPKATTPKSTLSKPSTNKTSRPNQQNRPKPSTRRTTTKPDILKVENATAKVEKVTLRPIQMLTTPKSKAATEKPMFVTKIKASIVMDTQKPTPTLPSSTESIVSGTSSKPTSSNPDFLEVPVRSKPVGAKINNVLKVQLKKPLDETTKIEIQPIKVNAPVLKIEKVENPLQAMQDKDAVSDKDTVVLDNSRIDLKFDFNPELTKINVETSGEASTASTPTSSTTKRPRQNSKRKKNKGRRRKPSTTAASTASLSTTTSSSSTESEVPTELSVLDTDIQESKTAPESKVAVNSTKTKKKPPQKAISTQIYNFLSREVMPSFGMMSLLGLGLGLASYFLYPFGGTIARRNYEIEPKYKYNLDEYGGNYGQSEEEVLAKVLQGMTSTDNKYPGTKEYDNNYYRYQHYDGNYDSSTTRKPEQRYPSVSSSPIYRPDNPASGVKYRNTDYRYPDVSSTPGYYDRTKHPEYAIGPEVPNPANRQFVVGNIPKEYPQFEDKMAAPTTPGKMANTKYEATATEQTPFEREVAPGYKFPGNAGNLQNYGHQETQTLRTEDGYEEVEITPTAVAVEHGPRSLKKRSLANQDSMLLDDNNNIRDELLRDVKTWRTKRGVKKEVIRSSRFKRDSVIQVIPSKKELEEEAKEENLSNEILDIIDSALPEVNYDKSKNRREDNEVEDLDAQKTKKHEEERTRLKESKMKTTTSESSTVPESSPETKNVTDSPEDTSTTISSTSSPATEVNSDETTSNSKGTEQTTVDWSEVTTKSPPKPEENGFNLFSFVKKVAEIKFRLGLTLLKHASEGFARYLGHVQKRINGEE